MKRTIHAIAAVLAMGTMSLFWLSSVTAELFLDEEAIRAVKIAIPWGLLWLVPAIAATGGSGFSLAGRRRGSLVGAKKARMRIVAANGLLVLVPSALFLGAKANRGELDGAFHVVQVLELAVGAVNLALMGRNMWDGLRMTGRLRTRPSSLKEASRAPPGAGDRCPDGSPAAGPTE